MNKDVVIVTNNPLVLKEMEHRYSIIYKETTFDGILEQIRDLIHKGYRLLTHPLSGSVKPGETPYKSVLMSRGERLDMTSLTLIEDAIRTGRKFEDKSEKYSSKTLDDLKLIDMDLLKGAIASAYI